MNEGNEKQFRVRFNLDKPDHRLAWDILHKPPGNQSMNAAAIDALLRMDERMNNPNLADLMNSFRIIIREELADYFRGMQIAAAEGSKGNSVNNSSVSDEQSADNKADLDNALATLKDLGW